MSIKKVLIYLSIFLLLYTVVIFIYVSGNGLSLGKGYRWSCFEPGCVILRDSKILIYGNVTEFNFNEKYIIGKVGKPNPWLVKHEGGGAPIGYFIVNKKTNAKAIGLDEEKFEQLCIKLNIDSCTLKKYTLFSFIYDPFYWSSVDS